MNRKKRRTAGVPVSWWALAMSILIHAAIIFLIPSVQILSPGTGYIEVEHLLLSPEDEFPGEEEIGPDVGEIPATAPARLVFEQIPTQFQAIEPDAEMTVETADTMLLSDDRQPREVLAENQEKSASLSPDMLPPAEVKRDWVLPKRRSELSEIPEVLVEPAPPPQENDVLHAEERYAEWLQTQTTQFVKTAREPALPEPLLPEVIEQERPSQNLILALAKPQKQAPEITPIVPAMPAIIQEKQPIRPEDAPTPQIISPEPTPVRAESLPVQTERFQAYTAMPPDFAPRLIVPDANVYALAQQPEAQHQENLAASTKRVLLPQLPTPVPQQPQTQPIRPTPPALSETDVRPIEELPARIPVPARPNQQQQAAARPTLRLPELSAVPLPQALQPASGTQSANARSLPPAWQSSKRTIPVGSETAKTGSRPGERSPSGIFVDKGPPSAPEPESDVTLDENDAIEQAITNPALSRISDDSIEGPASVRQVTYKPQRFPEIELDAEVDLRLKFWVLPDGTVGEVIPLQRGDVRLEQAAITYLKQWRFNPVDQDLSDVWGIVVIRYKLR